jgi:hypothetical protein
MIRYLITLGLVILIFSCKNNTKTSTNLIETETISNDTIIPFHGLWASEQFINSLKKTKSLNQSLDNAFFLTIPKSYKEMGRSHNYYEGFDLFKIIRVKKCYYLKDTLNGKNDSTPIIFFDDENKMKILNTVYIKRPKNIGIPEEILFTGKYKIDNRYVTFYADGTINGLDSIKFYSIHPEYLLCTEDYIINAHLFLGKNSSEELAYCYEFKSDTLLIYEANLIKIDEDYGPCQWVHEKGKIKWTLIKENN